jgi:putative ABC transport system permease protein
MLRNYFTIAVRNLGKHKFFGIINVTGLSLGIACALLITLFVIDELGYDKFNAKSDRIYRLISHIKFGGNDARYAVCPAPLARTIREEVPEIEDVVRFRSWGTFLVKKDKENYKEYNAIWAEPSVFNIFTIPLLKGNINSVLKEPNTMVISESAARKYFGNDDPLNQTLMLNGDMLFTVTGIYRDIPRRSHFHFDMMLAMNGLEESHNNEWLSNNFNTYYLVKEGADVTAIRKKINDLFFKYAGPQAMAFTGKTIDELLKEGTIVEEIPQPLKDIHLRSDALVELEANGDIRYVYIFSVVAVFILLLAIVNFINLATARSADRAREVGLRKVLGSQRKLLIFQFLTESIIMSIAAVIVGVILANLLMPFFNSLSGKALFIPNGNIFFWLIIIPVGIVVGILAGIYPALILSAFRPMIILSGKIAAGSRSRLIRSILVVFQFTISTVLITGTIAVYNQMNFIQHFKLGYNKDQVIIVDVSAVSESQARAFKDEVLNDPVILSSSVTGFLPVSYLNRNNTTYWIKGNRTPETSVNMQSWPVDHDYVKTLGMQIVAGRDFSQEYPSDSAAIILNEHAAKLFGFKNPIGEEIQVFEGTSDNSIDLNKIRTFHIIGIVQDFNFESLHETIGSLCMYLGHSNDRISFRYEPAQTSHALKSIEKTWHALNPEFPFEYTYLDQSFARMYSTESRTGRIVTSFAVLAILIACLGLFALASFMTIQRSREIGIRKVMGASPRDIIYLLSKNFTFLVLTAFLLSVPIAWTGINLWLRSFVYKNNPGIFLFFAVGITVLIIAWLTVAYQSYKAASANPVNTLRNE